MSDGDRIGKLSPRWSRMYRKVCEGYLDQDQLAGDAVKQLKKDIKTYGDYPIRFLRDVSNHLRNIQNNPLFHAVHNWDNESRYLFDLKSNYLKNYRLAYKGIEIAFEAARGLVNKIRNGEKISANLEEALYDGYLHRMYESNFSDIARVMLQGNDEIIKRIDDLDISLNKEINFIAPQLVKRKNTKRLRLKPYIRHQRPISIKDDVFSLGNIK